jgi:hypothetical protein
VSRALLLVIKGAISELPAEERASIEAYAKKYRDELDAGPREMGIAFALVATELAVEDE